MADIIILAVATVITLLVFTRKTSAGVAILSLLAGVLLDQLLGSWLVGLLPSQSGPVAIYLPATLRLLITFGPMLVSLVAVKVPRSNPILSLLSSLMLGVLVVFFGVEIVVTIPGVSSYMITSGFLVFVMPYENLILAASALLAVLEMVVSHGVKPSSKKKKK